MAKKKSKSKPKKGKKLKLEMDFISMKTLEGKSSDEKIESILENVKEGHLVVLDGALTHDEEAKLVTITMEGIHEDFTGIEFCSLPKSEGKLYSTLVKFLEFVTRKKYSKPGLTLVGPSKIIRKIKRDPNAFYVSAEL